MLRRTVKQESLVKSRGPTINSFPSLSGNRHLRLKPTILQYCDIQNVIILVMSNEYEIWLLFHLPKLDNFPLTKVLLFLNYPQKIKTPLFWIIKNYFDWIHPLIEITWNNNFDKSKPMKFSLIRNNKILSFVINWIFDY